MARARELQPPHIWFFPVLIAICLLVEINGQGLSVIGQKCIRPNSTYTVALSNSLLNGVQLEILLEGSSDGNIVYSQSNKILVNRRSGKSIAFQLSSIPAGEYSLAMRSMNPAQFSFSHTVDLLYDGKTMSIFIQTDKPVYNPGDKLRFRVVVVDVETRPATSIKTVSVSLKDAEENSIREWGYARLENGVFESAVQLASSPILGNWTLAVKTTEKTVEKYIELREYTLPKFFIKAYAPEVLLADKQKILVAVETAYTFGNHVDGTATVDLYLDEMDRKPEQSKTISITGLATVTFDLEEELEIEPESVYKDIFVKVKVMEAFTNRTVNITQPIPVFRYPYQLKVIKSTPLILPEVPFTFSVSVQDHKGIPVKTSNELELTIRYERPDSDVETTEHQALSNGLATFVLDPPPALYQVVIQANYDSIDYGEIATIMGAKTSSNQYMRITLNKKYKVRANKEVQFDISCTEKMGLFSYIIVSRGSIVASNVVNAMNKKKYALRLKLTQHMSPNARIIVSYTNKDFLIFDNMELNFDEFNNNFKLSLDMEEYEPGQDIHIDVDAAKDSYVAFHAIDESVLLLGRDGHDFTKKDVLTELALYGATEMNEFDPFNSMGLFLKTTAEVDFPVGKTSRFGGGIIGTDKKVVTPVHIRTQFPESWLWMNFTMDGRNSHKYFNHTVPDTITSWKVGGFALSPTLGLGIMSQPQSIIAKQPFFIVTNLPYSIKRDEIALIQVTVFNFLGNTVTTDVTIFNKMDDFEFVDKSSTNTTRRTKVVAVPTHNGKPISFMIKAKKLGEIAIKTEAVNLLASDSEEHMLRVTPESRLYEKNQARFVELPTHNTQNFEITIDIPRNVDEGSAKNKFSLDANLLGMTVKNFGSIIRLPSGCGEQNMVNFVPNIVVLDYLTETDTETDAVKTKATDYLNSGYQNQMKYKRSDGSFSVWGRSDSKGSTFLTAFVSKSLKIADKYIDVDKSVVSRAFSWLAQQQRQDGRFEEVGPVIHVDMQGALRSTNYALTAYVLIAFLENNDIASQYTTVIEKSTNYLVTNFETMTDAYDLALSTYALSLGTHHKKTAFLNKLVENSIMDRNTSVRYWIRGSASIEVAGYALLSYIAQDSYVDATPIMRWLNNQRYGLGGFKSTQDTFVGLKALAKFAAKMSSRRNNYKVTIRYPPAKVQRFDVDKDNSLVVQEVDIPAHVRKMTVEIEGIGTGMFQVATQFYQNILVANPSFELTAEVLDTTTNYVQHLKVCVRYIQKESQQRSNMALVEVFLPSGIVADKDAVQDLSPLKEIKKTELRFSDTSVVVYYNSLGTASFNCFVVTAYRRYKIARHLPANVVVYDYYDLDRFAIATYEGKVMQECDICDDEDCHSLKC